MSASIASTGVAFYPTPPSSPDPDIVLVPAVTSPTPKVEFHLHTQQIAPLTPPPEAEEPIFHGQNTSVELSTSPIPDSTQPVFVPALETPPLPISLLLNTSHHLPYASTLRLTSATGILATLGGNRILQLDSLQTLWDRMPYSATTASSVIVTADASEEDQIEALVGGDRPEPGVWSLRNHK